MREKPGSKGQVSAPRLRRSGVDKVKKRRKPERE
jgi:hypothetical protein